MKGRQDSSNHAHRALVACLLIILGAILVQNFGYLYSTPTPNTLTWWAGDETWLMSQYRSAIQTGKYIYPFAESSTFTHGSGVLFGSCWLSVLLYGLPSVLTDLNPIDSGRIVTFVLSVCMLVAFYRMCVWYEIHPLLAGAGAIMLSSSICFLLVSHSARSDVFIGLANFLIIGFLPKYLESGLTDKKSALVGLLTAATLLINGHVLIDCGLAIGFMLVSSGFFKRSRFVMLFGGMVAAGIGLFAAIQFFTVGSWSLFGQFTGGAEAIPLMKFFHPRMHLGVWNMKWFYVNEWAKGYLWPSAFVVAALLLRRIFSRPMPKLKRDQSRWIIGSLLLVLSVFYLELSPVRYLIYWLPLATMLLMFGVERLLRVVTKLQRIAIRVGLGAVVSLALWGYFTRTADMGYAGDRVLEANTIATKKAADYIVSHRRTVDGGQVRVVVTIPGQYTLMNDPRIRPIVPLFLWVPDTVRPSKELWKRLNAEYAMTYNGPASMLNKEGDTLLPDWLREGSELVYADTGTFTDIGRDYTASALSQQDTLRVYRLLIP